MNFIVNKILKGKTSQYFDETLEDKFNEIIQLSQICGEEKRDIRIITTNSVKKHFKYYLIYFIQFISLIVYDYFHFQSINLLLHMLIFFIEFMVLFLLIGISSTIYDEIKKIRRNNINGEILLKYKIDELTKNEKYIKITKLVKMYSEEDKKRINEIQEKLNEKINEKLRIEKERIEKEYKEKYTEEFNRQINIVSQRIGEEYQKLLTVEKNKLKNKLKINTISSSGNVNTKNASPRKKSSPRIKTNLSNQLTIHHEGENEMNNNNNNLNNVNNLNQNKIEKENQTNDKKNKMKEEKEKKPKQD